MNIATSDLVPAAPGTLPLTPSGPHIALHHPDTMPRIYALVCDGACVEPTYMDGQLLLFSKVERWVAGDFVAIYRRPETVPHGENPVLLKKLVSAPPPSFFKQAIRTKGIYNRPIGTVRGKVIARMLNPERSLMLDAEDVLAIHKCLGPIANWE